MTLLAAPRPADRARRLRPIPGEVLDPVIVSLASLVIYALHGFQSPIKRDLGTFLYGGEQFAHGVPPYVGVFNTVGPLADAVPGVAIWFGHRLGLDPVLSARLLFLVLSAVCCGLVSVLARDAFHSRTAGLLAPAVFLTFECFTELASSGPREKTTMLVFLLGSLILIGRRRWLGAGACAALATLTWQPVLFVPVVAMLVAVLTARTARTRAVALFVVGGAIPTVLTVVYFALEGATRRALDGFFVVNMRYTSQPTIFNDWVLKQLWHGYHTSLVLIVAGLLAILVLAGRAAPYAVLPRGMEARPDAEATVAWRLTAMGAGALASIVWTISVVNGGPDLFVVLPFAALGLGGALTLLAARLPRRMAISLVALIVAAGVVLSSLQSVTSRDDGLMVQRADARLVFGTQPGDATVLSIDAPQALAVVSRQSVWSYQLFDDRMAKYFDAVLPGGNASLGTRLEEVRPTFVVVSPSTDATWQLEALAEHYTRVGGGPGWIWYLSKDAGQRALLAARAANRAAMGRPAPPSR